MLLMITIFPNMPAMHAVIVKVPLEKVFAIQSIEDAAGISPNSPYMISIE